VLQHVDGDVAVEIAVRKVQARLAVAGDGLYLREPPADLRRHVLAELDRVVVCLLLGRQLFVVKVLAETGADLDRGPESGVRVLDRERVVEFLDDPKAVRQLLVPDLHELVAYAACCSGVIGGRTLGHLAVCIGFSSCRRSPRRGRR
jgi:hypothetical protein